MHEDFSGFVIIIIFFQLQTGKKGQCVLVASHFGHKRAKHRWVSVKYAPSQT